MIEVQSFVKQLGVRQKANARRMFSQVVVLLLVPYALPLLMPSWRWLLAYAVAVALLLTILFTIWYQAVMTTPTRTGLEVIGLVIPVSAAISTAAGTMVRTVTLFVRARSVAIAISILGALTLIVSVLVWANR
jgi:hypothetical protein